MNTIMIYLCKLITQYTFTCLHSIAMETESTLVDIIAKECMHPVFSDKRSMYALKYQGED